MNIVQSLRERQAELKATLARPVERPEVAALEQTEAELRAAEAAEQAAAAREVERRAVALAPELERARSRTMAAIHGFATAFEAEQAVRERAHDAGLGELGPWSVAPFLAAPFLRLAAENKETR